MDSFKFVSDDAFYIWGRCFSFQGKVLSGEVSKDEEVMIQTKDGLLYAKVDLIIKLSDRKVIETSIKGERIAIGLHKFSKEELNNIEKNFNSEVDKEPLTTEFLGVEYPIHIHISDKT
ncbi:hypothetical protein [Aquimarina brevivitae]|uniref:Uncharacterized protein n=1 Tax=Aquimarina brevivitae TaxID=323412 RepID=A0A4Q7PI79_9FLAO|nr:hypothetical protein [Aquimarina brevivitae]RZT00136.1 hypothetical protein EV197_1369 [Aquimarina brevivitae]